jgi:light-regulated signal transduction histidine kinase (bacteriophytochrome)
VGFTTGLDKPIAPSNDEEEYPAVDAPQDASELQIGNVVLLGVAPMGALLKVSVTPLVNGHSDPCIVFCTHWLRALSVS